MDCRLYCLDLVNAILGVEEARCPSDRHALDHAKALLAERDPCHGIEIWEQARLIGRVRRDKAA